MPHQSREAKDRKSAVQQRPLKPRDHYREVAVEACRPSIEESCYPEELAELGRILAPGGHVQAPLSYPGHNRARSIMARGIPYQEMTRRDGTTRAPHMKGDPKE